ncbi:hypothetical protein, partial [Chitinophaga sp.]|uniref:hypothetical protein n=1 Tax=Chitinophaga sp. TaxID=1869181 RepID=UPI002C847248
MRLHRIISIDRGPGIHYLILQTACKQLSLVNKTSKMDIPGNFIKIFPEYQDVFYDDLENHRKYFLPLCSINLKFFSQNKDQWLHFVS